MAADCTFVENCMNRLRLFFYVFLPVYMAVLNPGRGAYATDEADSNARVTSAQPTPQELQQLVAPIALYPDSLAQILAASNYPAQIVGRRSLTAGASRAHRNSQ